MIIVIALAGSLGAICRFLLSSLLNRMPAQLALFSTTIINLVGSFLLGLCFGLSTKNPDLHHYFLILSYGFFAAFTTFSTFSYEAYTLIKRSKIRGVLFILISVIIATCCSGLGVILIN